MESLLQQGIKFEKGDEEGGEIDGLGGESGAVNNTAVDKPARGGLARAGEWFPRERNSSYESATMKVVEELQDSVRGLLAKMSAAIESAGEMGMMMRVFRFGGLHATNAYIDKLCHCCILQGFGVTHWSTSYTYTTAHVHATINIIPLELYTRTNIRVFALDNFVS